MNLGVSLGHPRDDQEEELRRLDRLWPVECAVTYGPPDSLFNFYPRVYRPFFNGIADDRIDELSLCCRLIASAIVVADGIVDCDTEEPSRRTTAVVRSQAMQFEAQARLGILLPELAFWQKLRQIFAVYALASCRQVALRTSSIRLLELNVSEARDLATGKTKLSHLVLIGLAALANCPPKPDLERVMDTYNLARQLLDDLTDWRSDLEAGRPTTMVARLVETIGASAVDPAWRSSRSPALAVYYDGLAFQQLTDLQTAIDGIADVLRKPEAHALAPLFARLVAAKNTMSETIVDVVSRRR